MTQPLTWSRTPIPEMDFGLSIQESHGFSRVECQHEDDTNKYVVLSKEFQYEYDDDDQVFIKEVRYEF